MDTCRPFDVFPSSASRSRAPRCSPPRRRRKTPELHKLTVKYSDLNIASAAGATTLYHRIRGAARFVCGEEGRGIDEQLMWNSCFHASSLMPSAPCTARC